MKLEVRFDAEAAAGRGAEVIAAAARDAVARRGSFAFAASGGRAPWRMFELLGAEEVPWERVDIFQVDERVLPDTDDGRNLVHLLESLPEPARRRVHPMGVTEEDLGLAAAAYAAGLPSAIDLVHLGLGPDGHTASLVPGDPVLGIDDRRVALTAGPYQGSVRMTLTYPELARARRILWLVTGRDKRAPLGALLARDARIPAGRVDAPDALVIADAEAGPASSEEPGTEATQPGAEGSTSAGAP